MSSVRRVSASLAFAALVSPFAGGALLTAHTGALLPFAHSHHGGHHIDDDHRHDHEHAYDFQQVFHGHRHDRTTPEHSHPSVFAGVPTTLGPAAPRVIPTDGSHAIERAGGASGSPDAARAGACELAEACPSPPSDPPLVLRI
jgi:hypothetical protein